MNGLLEINKGRQAKVYKYNDQALKIMTLTKYTHHHFKEFNQSDIKNIEGLIKYKSIKFDQMNIFIYMDLYETDLFDYIKKRNTFLDEKETKIIFRKLFKTVKEMHDKGLCHRDIKPENILMNDNKITDSTEIVLCDLEAFANTNGYFSRLSYGTPYYLAPEGEYHSVHPKLDIYSMGKTLWMTTGCEKTRMSNSMYNLYCNMTNTNVQERFDIDQVISHEWIQS